MISEDDVLFAVKEFLLERGWEIVAYRSPGGHGGLVIRPDSGPHEGDLFVLDLVAVKDKAAICLEAKSAADRRDQEKLDLLFSEPSCRAALQSAVRNAASESEAARACRLPLSLVKAVAFASGDIAPEDYVVFRVSPEGDVEVRHGAAVSCLAAEL